jgi:hypothetical protein
LGYVWVNPKPGGLSEKCAGAAKEDEKWPIEMIFQPAPAWSLLFEEPD